MMELRDYKQNVNKPMVSIIMPAFNVVDFISCAIESVINQTHRDWELIICDDSSTDGTLKVLKQISDLDNRIIITTNSLKKGAPGARNSAIKLATGKYIAFLDADDFWFPSKLEKQIECIQETKAMMVHSNYYLMTEGGVKSNISVMTPNKVTRKKMKFANFLPCLTVMYDSEKLGKNYQPNIQRRNDYALWLEMFSNKKDLISVRCNGILAAYRVNSYGLSSNSLLSLKFHWLALVNHGKYNPITASILSSIFLFIVLIKKKLPKTYNMFLKNI